MNTTTTANDDLIEIECMLNELNNIIDAPYYHTRLNLLPYDILNIIFNKINMPDYLN